MVLTLQLKERKQMNISQTTQIQNALVAQNFTQHDIDQRFVFEFEGNTYDAQFDDINGNEYSVVIGHPTGDETFDWIVELNFILDLDNNTVEWTDEVYWEGLGGLTMDQIKFVGEPVTITAEEMLNA